MLLMVAEKLVFSLIESITSIFRAMKVLTPCTELENGKSLAEMTYCCGIAVIGCNRLRVLRSNIRAGNTVNGK